MVTKTRVVFFAWLLSFIVMGMAQTAQASDTFYIDDFSITKNGLAWFNDPFNDGSPPPSVQNTIIGGNTSTLYSMLGSVGPESGMGLSLAGSGRVPNQGASGKMSLTQHAILESDTTTTNFTKGLKSNDTFSVTGIFNLVVPSLGSSYWVNLTDGTSSNATDDWVSMEVWTSSTPGNSYGKSYVGLIYQNFVSATDQVMAADLLAPGNAQIALTLTRANTTSNTVTGSYAYINGGVWGSLDTFTPTAPIFDVEDFTRAEFGASSPVPVPASLLLLGPGLVGLAAIRRRLKK